MPFSYYGLSTNLGPVAYIVVLPEADGLTERCKTDRSASSAPGDGVLGMQASARTEECQLLRTQPSFEMAGASLGVDLGWRFTPTRNDKVGGQFTVNFTFIATPWNAHSGYQPSKPQAFENQPPNVVFTINGYSFESTRVLHRAALNIARRSTRSRSGASATTTTSPTVRRATRVRTATACWPQGAL